MNVIVRLEYELAYYDSAVHRFNHYATRTPTLTDTENISNRQTVNPLSSSFNGYDDTDSFIFEGVKNYNQYNIVIPVISRIWRIKNDVQFESNIRKIIIIHNVLLVRKKISQCLYFTYWTPLAFIFGMRIFMLQWSLNKFPDFFRMGTFIDSTHMKL